MIGLAIMLVVMAVQVLAIVLHTNKLNRRDGKL